MEIQGGLVAKEDFGLKLLNQNILTTCWTNVEAQKIAGIHKPPIFVNNL